MDSLLFLSTAYYVLWTTKKKLSEDSLRQSLQDGTSRDSQERVCTVSKDNIPTPNGHLRSEMRLQNLWHRATYILVRHHHHQKKMILVQRRSMLKDYCPGKLDPFTGGVVGFGESYQENAVREIQEEMGIDVSEENPQKNRMDRVFTFSYKDNKVRVWGEFFETVYNGPIEDLKIQEEEVDEVLTMTMEELQKRIHENPYDFLPDSCHAMKLYFQRSSTRRI